MSKMREQGLRSMEGRALAPGYGNMCKGPEAAPMARRQPFCFPMTACRTFHSQVTSSTLPLLCPHFHQVLGSKSDSPMGTPGQRVQEIHWPLCFPLVKCNVATTALELHQDPVFLSCVTLGKSLKMI